MCFAVNDMEIPYLVLGAENFVVKQSLLELTRDEEKVLRRPKSILVTGQYPQGLLNMSWDLNKLLSYIEVIHVITVHSVRFGNDVV